MTGSSRDLHDRLMKAYDGDKPVVNYIKSDFQILKENYQFLLEDEEGDDLEEGWEYRMVKAYHDHLYKEYCLADLSRVSMKDSPIGLRWRSESEVVKGKGQFSCGSVHCQEENDLSSWEIPFGYIEKGIKKMALVKLRLCSICSDFLPSSKRKPWIQNQSELLP